MQYRCKYCTFIGIRADFEIDHVNPISRFPLQNIIQPTLDLICSGCNRQKGKMTDEEYLFWRLINFAKANFGPIK